MKKVLIIVLLTTCSASYGQVQDSIEYEGKKFPVGNTVTFKEPLFVISLDNQTIQVTQSELFRDSISIKPEWILSIHVLKGQDAITKYGERGKQGVILIDLKKESLDLLSPEMKGKLTAYKN